MFAYCKGLTEITILSPECIIEDYESTISNGYDSDNNNYYFAGTIYSYDNSTAQAYAEKYKRNFVSLGTAPSTSSAKKGDANNDGLLDVADVVAVASYVGNSEANKLDEQCIKNADVHNTGDGLTASDALMIQQYLAKIIENL